MDLPKIEAGRETVKPQNVDVSAVLRDVSNAVQNVVDDAQKELAGALDLLEIGENLDMFGPDAVFTEHLAVTNDGVKRGAQFVAHVRQKNALRAIGLLGGVARPLEFPCVRLSSLMSCASQTYPAAMPAAPRNSPEESKTGMSRPFLAR